MPFNVEIVGRLKRSEPVTKRVVGDRGKTGSVRERESAPLENLNWENRLPVAIAGTRSHSVFVPKCVNGRSSARPFALSKEGRVLRVKRKLKHAAIAARGPERVRVDVPGDRGLNAQEKGNAHRGKLNVS